MLKIVRVNINIFLVILNIKKIQTKISMKYEDENSDQEC